MDFIQVNENDLQQQTKKRGTKRNRSSFLVMKNVCLVCIISLPIVEIHSFTTTPQVISFTRKNHVIECSLLSRKTRINNNKSNINDRSLNTVHENYNQLTSSSTLDYSSTGSRFLTKGTKNLLRNCKTSLLMSSVPSSSSSSNLSKDNNNVIIKKKSAIDIDDVESYHPLFSSNDISSDDENFDYAMHNNNKHNNHNKKQTNSWFNWFVKGSKPRGTNRVIMREAEELGGIARNDRYSSKDWYHNTITLPSSAILRNIRSPVLAVTCWATFLSLLHLKLLNTKYYLHVQYMYIPTTPHSLMMSALGLLLVFRTNSAYQRFAEGRVIWERIINASRDLSRLMILYNDEIGIDKRRRLQRLLVAFPYLLRHRIRPNLVMRRLDDENYERNPKHTILLYQDSGIKDNDVDAAMLAKVEEETGKSRRKKRPLYWVDKRTLPWRLVPPEALEKLCRAQNRPLWVCDRMAQEIHDVPDQLMFSSRERFTLLKYIDTLSRCIGGAERIHQTMVPLNYARHTLRALTLWLFSLPFALIKDLRLGTGPMLFLVSWLLFGVYEIGYAIEDPFQGTLRLSILCDTIRRDVLGDENIRGSAFLLEVSHEGKTIEYKDDEEQEITLPITEPTPTADQLPSTGIIRTTSASTEPEAYQ